MFCFLQVLSAFSLHLNIFIELKERRRKQISRQRNPANKQQVTWWWELDLMKQRSGCCPKIPLSYRSCKHEINQWAEYSVSGSATPPYLTHHSNHHVTKTVYHTSTTCRQIKHVFRQMIIRFSYLFLLSLGLKTGLILYNFSLDMVFLYKYATIKWYHETFIKV